MSRTAFRTLISLLAVLALSNSSVWAQVGRGRATTNTAIDYTALQPGQQAVVAVVVDIGEGFHAQSHTPSDENFIKFEAKLDDHPAIVKYDPIYPPGENQSYPALGTLNVYEGRVHVYVPIQVKSEAPLGPVELKGKVTYQICDDQQCFAPESPKFTIKTEIVSPGTPVQPNQPELFANYKAPSTKPATISAPETTMAAKPATAPTETASRVVVGGRSEWTIMTAFGAALLAGLLFNVMPCVLPVLPLKAAAFHRAAEHHRSRSIVLGTAFSLGIIAVFALLAVLVLVLRVISWGGLFSNPWFVWSLVILLVACAMGMFGAFNITLPTALYSVDPRQDTFGGNVIFGAFTAILATPCTAPLLPPLLLWASAQPSYLGVPAMLMVGVGMALPYFILSAFPEAARKFPQTGPWAELFKQLMGFLLLAAAAYFAGGRLIHGPGFWWLVVAVVAVGSFYLIARTVQLTESGRAVGIACTLAVAMLGGTLWWTAKINGIGGSGAGGGSVTESWTPYTDAAFARLRDSGKPVLVKFTANWCATCQYIEGTVFRDAKVWEALKSRDVATVKVDLTDDGAPGNDLLLKLNPAGGIPLTAIYTPGKNEPIVISSIYSSSELLAALDRATNGARASVE